MLGDFEHEAVAAIVGLERVQDLGQVIVELHVDHGTHDLAHPAFRATPCCDLPLLVLGLGDHRRALCFCDGGFLCHC